MDTQKTPNPSEAEVLIGWPERDALLHRRCGFVCHDAVAWIQTGNTSALIVRDVERQRAERESQADAVHTPAQLASINHDDLELALATAAGVWLKQQGVTHAISDRTMPLLLAKALETQGIAVRAQADHGAIELRMKSPDRLAQIRQAQHDTQAVLREVLKSILNARANAHGVLHADGARLTADSVRARIRSRLLERGYTCPPCLVAQGATAADCHQLGSGPLVTGLPILVDVFPRHDGTLACADCTRTVVHGSIPAEVERMHEAVMQAKLDATDRCRLGHAGGDVHAAAVSALEAHGYAEARGAALATLEPAAMTHGTGHGLGFHVHEAPLLDAGGAELVLGDALTVEPGLYHRELGAVRVEDLVFVTESEPENVSDLPTGLRLDH